MFKVAVVSLLLIELIYGNPRTNRVINGTETVRGQYPFMVSVRNSSGSHICGASIVDKQWILTAAHCVDGQLPDTINIQYAVTTIDENGPNLATVKKIYIHEQYNPDQEFANDIALLQLEGRFSLNGKTIAVANLPVSGFEVPQGAVGTLIGWSSNSNEPNGEIEKTLKQADLNIYTAEECAQKYEGSMSLDQLCASSDGTGHCVGDAGGPLIHNGVQIGVLAWNKETCSQSSQPGVYTKLSHYVDWINRLIK